MSKPDAKYHITNSMPTAVACPHCGAFHELNNLFRSNGIPYMRKCKGCSKTFFVAQEDIAWRFIVTKER